MRVLVAQLDQALAQAGAAAAAIRAREDSPEVIGLAARKAAHEFNNLLTVLGSSVELLRHPSLPEARRERYLTAIEATTGRAAEMTRKIQALARRLAPRCVDVDLCARLGKLMREARLVEGASDAGPFPVCIDPADFDDAILSLTREAQRALQDSERLRLELRLAHVPADQGRAQDHVRAILASPAEGGAAAAARFVENMAASLTGAPDPGADWLNVFAFAARYHGAISALGVGEQAAVAIDIPARTKAPASAPIDGPLETTSPV